MQDTAAAAAALHKVLEPGEVLEWAGCPAAVTLAGRQAPGLAFITVWIGGVGHAYWSALLSESAGASAAVPGMMLAFGLFFLVGVVDSMLGAWRTFYGVTDRRLLVLEQGLRRRVTSWTPKQITSVELRQRGVGRGDVVFHQSLCHAADGSGLVSAAFIDVADASAVEARVRRLAAS